MEQLPIELYSQIASQVPLYYDEFNQFITALSVNRRMREILRDDQFWHYIYLYNYGDAALRDTWFKMFTDKLYVPLISMERLKIGFEQAYADLLHEHETFCRMIRQTHIDYRSYNAKQISLEEYVKHYVQSWSGTQYRDDMYYVRKNVYNNYVKYYVPYVIKNGTSIHDTTDQSVRAKRYYNDIILQIALDRIH